MNLFEGGAGRKGTGLHLHAHHLFIQRTVTDPGYDWLPASKFGLSSSSFILHVHHKRNAAGY